MVTGIQQNTATSKIPAVNKSTDQNTMLQENIKRSGDNRRVRIWNFKTFKYLFN